MEETHDTATMTWGDFRRVFETEYRTVDQVHEKIQEFINLKQGMSTVKEYSEGVFSSIQLSCEVCTRDSEYSQVEKREICSQVEVRNSP